MKLLPFDKFSLQTRLSPAQIIDRLAPHVEPVRFIRLTFQHREFEGRVTSSGFRLRWIMAFIRPFLPVVYGRFEPRDQGTAVEVQMAPHPVLLLLLTYWLLALSGLVFERETKNVAVMLGLGFFMAWIVALVGFWLEDGRSRRRLTALLSDAEINKQPE